MIALPILVLVATFIVAAFWGIGICVIIDFVPSLKSRASTMQSSDSATQEQARRLRKQLQRARIGGPVVGNTTLNALDAATARTRMRMAIQDPSTKPRYASTSIIEDVKRKQEENFLNSSQNPAGATTVIMEPIPKAQRERNRLRTDDEVFESDTTNSIAQSSGNTSTTQVLHTSMSSQDNRRSSDHHISKPGYLTTGAKFYTEYGKHSPTEHFANNSNIGNKVLHGSQPNLSKKNDHNKKRYDRSNSTELLRDNAEPQSRRSHPFHQRIPMQRSFEKPDSKMYRPYLDTAIADAHNNSEPYLNNRNIDSSPHRRLTDEREGLLSQEEESYSNEMSNRGCSNCTTRHYDDRTTDNYRRAETLSYQETPTPHSIRLQNMKRQYSIEDENSGQLRVQKFPTKYNEYQESYDPHKPRSYYENDREDYNSFADDPKKFRPLQFRTTPLSRIDPNLHEYGNEKVNYSSCHECGQQSLSHSPARSRSSEDTKLSGMYLSNGSTCSEVIRATEAGTKFQTSPGSINNFNKQSSSYLRSSSSSSSASSTTSSRYHPKLHQHLEDIQEMEGRNCVEDSTIDSRDSIGGDSTIAKSHQSTSPLSCSSMYNNPTPACTPPSIATYSTEKFRNSQMKLIRQESQC